MAKQIIVNYVFGSAKQPVLAVDTVAGTARQYEVALDELVDFICDSTADEVRLMGGAADFFKKYKRDIEEKAVAEYNKKINVTIE